MASERVILIGMPGSGKSAVGAELAARLGWPFLDLDEDVVQRTGCPIPQLFAERGEAGFRAAEAEALAAALARTPIVIATGGGAPCHADSMERMLAAGLVVHLAASLRTLHERTAGGGRPLLDGGDREARLRGLFTVRTPVYRRAHRTVETAGRSPAEVATEVARLLGRPETIEVALGERAYPIVVDPGPLAGLGAHLGGRLPAGPIAVVTDERVGALYGEAAEGALRAAGFAPFVVTVPSGERAKTMRQAERLARELVLHGVERRTPVLALGGGVVSDLAGFVAATLLRGVPFVVVPTTLLAVVDAAIGGKTGVNLPEGKNLVGAFHQPRAVVAHLPTLATLPRRELRSGLAEVVKYGMIAAPGLLDVLLREARGVLRADPAALLPIVGECARVKAAVVARDEREERGERVVLNFGHTVGHAIEAAGGYRSVRHGEAVALGMVAAADVATRLGRATAAVGARLREVLAILGLPTDYGPWLRPEVLGRLGADKKRAGGVVQYVVVPVPGQAEVVPLAPDELVALLRG